LPDCIDSDSDGDGDPDVTDCADLNPNIYTGAPESCDAIDSDCDGDLVDQFADYDNDGSPDCVDTDDDGDGDPDSSDCADLNPAIYTGAPEVCDGVDNDCDGIIDDGFDNDNDSVTTCAGDCDDSNSSIYPGAPEFCDNTDSDCDNSLVDTYPNWDGDSLPDCVDSDDDNDGDPDSSDCNDNNASIYTGAPEITCNGIDEDCDGVDSCAVTVYSQNFSSSSLFSESIYGPQVFSDGAQWVDTCGNSSHLLYTSSPYGQAMAIYKTLACGSPSQLTLDVPASASSSETLTVTFWAYNPRTSPVSVSVQRALGSPVVISIPGGSWIERTATVSSGINTTRLLLQFGAISPLSSYVLKIDEIEVTRP